MNCKSYLNYILNIEEQMITYPNDSKFSLTYLHPKYNKKLNPSAIHSLISIQFRHKLIFNILYIQPQLYGQILTLQISIIIRHQKH